MTKLRKIVMHVPSGWTASILGETRVVDGRTERCNDKKVTAQTYYELKNKLTALGYSIKEINSSVIDDDYIRS